MGSNVGAFSFDSNFVRVRVCSFVRFFLSSILSLISIFSSWQPIDHRQHKHSASVNSEKQRNRISVTSRRSRGLFRKERVHAIVLDYFITSSSAHTRCTNSAFTHTHIHAHTRTSQHANTHKHTSTQTHLSADDPGPSRTVQPQQRSADMPESNQHAVAASNGHHRDRAPNGEAAVALLSDFRTDVPPIIVSEKNGASAAAAE